MKNMLFMVCVNSEYPVQLIAAREIKKHSTVNVIFCFNSIVNNLQKELQACKKEGFNVIELFKVNLPADGNITTYRFENYQHEKRKLTFSAFYTQLKQRKAIIKRFRLCIRDMNIGLVVVSNNKLDFMMPYLTKAVHLEKKKIVMLPFGMESMRSYQIKMSKNEYLNSRNSISKSILAFILKRWMFRCLDGKQKICIPVEEIFIMKWLSSAPSLPVSPYGGDADFLFSENNYMHNFYKDLVPHKLKLINTGAPYNDILYNALESRVENYRQLCEKYNVPGNNKLIVVSLPQYMPAYWKNVKEYNAYPDFVRAFFNSLSLNARNYNVFVSIHPRMYEEQIRMLATGFENVIIVQEYIAALIPLCEFYVCSESSTVRMAIACNKPVINYDLYQFRFDFFSATYGVITVSDEADLAKMLTAFCTKDSIYQAALAQQEQRAAEFGPITNKAKEQIAEHIFSILAI